MARPNVTHGDFGSAEEAFAVAWVNGAFLSLDIPVLPFCYADDASMP